jgi:hypothetical protein
MQRFTDVVIFVFVLNRQSTIAFTVVHPVGILEEDSLVAGSLAEGSLAEDSRTDRSLVLHRIVL